MCKPIYQRFLRQKSMRCVMQIAKHYLHSHKAHIFSLFSIEEKMKKK